MALIGVIILELDVDAEQHIPPVLPGLASPGVAFRRGLHDVPNHRVLVRDVLCASERRLFSPLVSP